MTKWKQQNHCQSLLKTKRQYWLCNHRHPHKSSFEISNMSLLLLLSIDQTMKNVVRQQRRWLLEWSWFKYIKMILAKRNLFFLWGFGWSWRSKKKKASENFFTLFGFVGAAKFWWHRKVSVRFETYISTALVHLYFVKKKCQLCCDKLFSNRKLVRHKIFNRTSRFLSNWYLNRDLDRYSNKAAKSKLHADKEVKKKWKEVLSSSGQTSWGNRYYRHSTGSTVLLVKLCGARGEADEMRTFFLTNSCVSFKTRTDVTSTTGR